MFLAFICTCGIYALLWFIIDRIGIDRPSSYLDAWVELTDIYSMLSYQRCYLAARTPSDSFPPDYNFKVASTYFSWLILRGDVCPSDRLGIKTLEFCKGYYRNPFSGSVVDDYYFIRCKIDMCGVIKSVYIDMTSFMLRGRVEDTTSPLETTCLLIEDGPYYSYYGVTEIMKTFSFENLKEISI